MELRAGCGGMAQAFVIATSMIASGKSKTALLIGSDLISPFISVINQKDYEIDKNFLASVAMFGDGAGAMVLTQSEGAGGILDCMSQSISTGRPAAMLLRTGGALSPPGAPGHQHPFSHDFAAILRYGPELIRSAVRWLRSQKGYDLSDVNFFIPPQVNGRLISFTALQMGVPKEKVVSDFERVGNTASASIYIALDQMNRNRLLKAGDLLVFLPAEATKWLFGAVVVRWSKVQRPVS